MASMQKELELRMKEQREENRMHMQYQKEYGFYTKIVFGDLTAVKEICEGDELQSAREDAENGVLSKDPVRNERYHFVVLASVLTRMCMEEGLNREKAYTISDLYINKMDETTDISGILEVQREMVLAYTREMNELHKNEIYSLKLRKAIDYVYDHISDHVEVLEVAQAVGTTRGYLDSLFRNEMHMTPRKFIKQVKLKEAAKLLACTDLSIMEIVQSTGFVTQSHFSKCFRQQYGTSPAKYRKKYYQNVSKMQTF